MRGNPIPRAALLAIAAATLAAAALAGCGDDGGGDERGAADGEATAPRTEDGTATPRPEGATAPAPRPRVPTIVVRGGEPVGGVRELEHEAGERVRFRVRSDVADHVHVHGYDLMKDVPAGGAVAFSFPADIEGIFEIELEERGAQIAELRVAP